MLALVRGDRRDMTIAEDQWSRQEFGIDCYLCPPRLSKHPGILQIAQLSEATLYLERDQRFRGLCALILNDHVTELDALTANAYPAYLQDLRLSVQAIRAALHPDHSQYLGIC
jgi:diadenosine tetraphosphate (Ap4A) HIT family hydrolase